MRAQPITLPRTVVAPRASLWGRIRAHAWSYLYVAPMVILLFAFTIYPSVASLGYTLFTWDGLGSPSAFVGLGNFQQVIGDPIFWQAFEHTFVYAGILVPVQLALALVLALVLNNPRLRGRTFYRAVYFIPVVTAPAVIGVVVQLILTNFGDNINQLLLNAHLIQSQSHIDWLGDPHTALYVIIAVGIWNTLGYNLIYFLAGLQSVPAELYEAARLDGAGALAQLVYITVPMLRAVGLVILVLAILGSLQVFDLVRVLTPGGGPLFSTEVVNTYIYRQAFNPANGASPNVGFASAASFFYGLILLAITALLGVARYAARRRAAPPTWASSRRPM